ncbi:hypothetical protein M8J76_017270 [Diaphorina citri]|nr:hypothetical protein M8J76_017270 [Diaphorina citri]
MKRRGRSQIRLNKNIIDNFNDETYIKLKSIVEKLGGRNNDDKIKNIFDEACEKWALKHDEVIKLNNKNDDLIKECEDLKDDKKALKNKVKELEKRMNALIEESEAQKNEPDDELNKEKFQCLKEGYEELQNEKDAMANKIRGLERRIKHLVEESDEQANSTNKELDERNVIIKSMEKQLKDLKMRESENYEDFTKLEQERNKLKNHIVKLEKTIEIHKQEHIENYEYIKTLELERKGLNFTISTLEKTIQRFENLGYKQMEKTLADDSIIDLENTVTHNSMLQFTKSFSIAHNETTFQEELDTLNCNKELAGQNENSNDLMEKERNMKHKETNDRDETKIEDHELGKLEKRITNMQKDIHSPERTDEGNQQRETNRPKQQQQRQQHQQQQSQKKKRLCYLIGDSHIRYLEEKIKNNSEFPNHYDIISNFKPGYGISNITEELLPSNTEGDDVVVLSAGTNDLFRTDPIVFEECLTKIANLSCKVILISIPPHANEYNNRNIVKLNTRIKHYCSNFININILNTHTFLKEQHLARDGIHIGRKGKEWLCQKIVNSINNKSDPSNKNHIMTQNTQKNTQKNVPSYTTTNKSPVPAASASKHPPDRKKNQPIQTKTKPIHPQNNETQNDTSSQTTEPTTPTAAATAATPPPCRRNTPVLPT